MPDFTVDWLSCTFPHDRDVIGIGRKLLSLWALPVERFTRPRNGYTVACENSAGVILQTSDRPSMGQNMVCTGQSLSTLSEVLPDFATRLAHVLRGCKTCSRLDVAIDIRPGSIVEQCIKDCKNNNYISHARKWSIIESAEGGKTLYLGARESERMLRVYDKSAQTLQPAGGWDRVELECKGGTALRLARALSQSFTLATVQGWINDFVRFPSSEWLLALTEAAGGYVPSQRRQTNTRDWLLNTVAPIVAHLTKEGDTTLRDDLAAVIEFLLRP